MKNDQVLIPEGWTYFAHRTNTERWDVDPFVLDVITIKGIMSVVTESEIRGELRDYGRNHVLGYSSGSGEPFEIRCLICGLPYLRSLDDNNELKKVMLNEFYYDRRNIGGCAGQRHFSIPPKEELLVIGVGNHDEVFGTEKKIIWTIPRRLAKFYNDELMSKSSRVIDINEKVDSKDNKKI